MNNFIHAIDRFFTNDVYYGDTDSIFLENKHWEKLDRAGLVGKNPLQKKRLEKRWNLVWSLFCSKIKILFVCK